MKTQAILGLAAVLRPVFLLCLPAVMHAGNSVRLGESWTVSSGVERVALLELYTSQGCSTCPGADRWLTQYVEISIQGKARLWNHVVPISWHVDYWDRLGWADPLGSPAWSARQRRMAAAASRNGVYTPGFFVNGREWRGWFDGRDPRLEAGSPGVLKLSGSQGSEGLRAEFTPAARRLAAGKGELTLHVALQVSGVVTNVRRGENTGRELRQDFAVLDLQSVPLTAAGSGGYRARVPDIALSAARANWPRGKFSLAAWVTSDRGGAKPLQAVGAWLD